MHQSSFDKMRWFREEFLKGEDRESIIVLDLGSQDVNGTYRPIFEHPRWTYFGVDMEAGKNVDVVLRNPYRWSELRSGSADVLISGQAFEHIEWFWLTMLEVERVLKPGGLCCIVAPAAGPEHRYPVDCWRFYPDGFAALARFARLEVLSVSTQWESKNYSDGSDQWKDSLLICRKSPSGGLATAKRNIRNAVLRYALRFLV
jgi:SAM-dependent methyltransferase